MFGAMNVVVVVVVQHLVCCVKILFWRRCHPPLLALKIIRACRGKQRRGRLSLLLRSPTRLPWIYSLLLPLLRRRPLKWEHTKNHADFLFYVILLFSFTSLVQAARNYPDLSRQALAPVGSDSGGRTSILEIMRSHPHVCILIPLFLYIFIFILFYRKTRTNTYVDIYIYMDVILFCACMFFYLCSIKLSEPCSGHTRILPRSLLSLLWVHSLREITGNPPRTPAHPVLWCRRRSER